MLYLFRKTRILYFGIMSVGIILSIFFFYKSHFDLVYGFLCLVFFAIWILIDAFIVSLYATKIYSKVHKILIDECNPIKFIEIMDKAMRRRPIGIYKTIILLNLSTAYWSLNNEVASKMILDGIVHFPHHKLGLDCRITYFNNLFYVFLSNNDLQNAEDVLNNIKITINDKHIAKANRDAWMTIYTEKLCMLNMAKGNYEGSEQIFCSMFERAKCMLTKIYAKFELGKIYLHYERKGEAKEAFEYVIEHGNKLYMVQEAKQYLSNI